MMALAVLIFSEGFGGGEKQLYSNLQGFINSAYNFVPNPKVAIKSNKNIMQRAKLLRGLVYTLALFLFVRVHYISNFALFRRRHIILLYSRTVCPEQEKPQIRRQMSLRTYLKYKRSILGWFGQPGSTVKKKLGPIMSNF